jgi:hypothetical protein
MRLSHCILNPTVHPKQACCTNGDARLYMLDKNTQTPTLSQEVFGQSGLPLSPLPSCMANHMSGLNTDEGSCNVLWCDCDHCYGARARGPKYTYAGSIVCFKSKTRANETAAVLTNRRALQP